MLVTIPTVLLKTSAAFFLLLLRNWVALSSARNTCPPLRRSRCLREMGQRLLQRQVQVSCPPGRSASGAAPARRGAGPGTPETADPSYLPGNPQPGFSA